MNVVFGSFCEKQVDFGKDAREFFLKHKNLHTL